MKQDKESKYITKQRIGRGAYGVVYLAHHPETNEMVVVKDTKNSASGVRYSTLREISMLGELKDHPNVVTLIEPVLTDEYTSLVLNYGGINLYSFMTRNILDKSIIRVVLRQVLEGLSFCHGKDIIHRDIKPHNILVNIVHDEHGLSNDPLTIHMTDTDESPFSNMSDSKEELSDHNTARIESAKDLVSNDNSFTSSKEEANKKKSSDVKKPLLRYTDSSKVIVQLADFGLARQYNESMMNGRELTPDMVTSVYRAPEIFVGTLYGKAVDMWSVGCVLAEMVIGDYLFHDGRTKNCSDMQVFQMICAYVATQDDQDWYHANCKSGARLRNLPRDNQLEKRFKPLMEPLAYDLLTKLLQFQPSNRLTVQQALSHPYFTTM